MEKSILFCISAWLYLHVWQARFDVKRNVVAIKINDTLFSYRNLKEFAIDFIVHINGWPFLFQHRHIGADWHCILYDVHM